MKMRPANPHEDDLDPIDVIQSLPFCRIYGTRPREPAPENFQSFMTNGKEGKIPVLLDTQRKMIWTDSGYTLILHPA
jgi:hypothetical protein